MPKDVHLARWSNVLYAMVIVTALLTVVGPIYAVINDLPVTLAKDNGKEIWKTNILAIPLFERSVFLLLHHLDNVAWLYGLLQIFRLAHYYKQGQIFEEANARCFLRIGIVLAIIGVLHSTVPVISRAFLYWRGISPWMGDIHALFVFQPDYIMAGIFFFVIGKVMRRARDLEESDRLIV